MQNEQSCDCVHEKTKYKWLIASGMFVRDGLMQIYPLSTPSTRVIVANLPPFKTDDYMRKELNRFGKFPSGFPVLSAGFQADTAEHVVSFRNIHVTELR